MASQDLDVSLLWSLLADWVASRPRNLEATAALKDCYALLEAAPGATQALILPQGVAEPVIKYVRDLLSFLKRDMVPLVVF